MILRSPRVWISLVLFVCIITFALWHERQLSAHDPANFVLALKYGYSIVDQRPHAPGYPGFYLLWKAVESLTLWQPHTVILFCNLIFAIIALTVTLKLGREVLGTNGGLMATALMLTDPLFLYYENVAEIYMYDAAFGAFVAWILLKRSNKHDLLFYFLYGLLGCFRLSSVILTAPTIAATLGYRFYKNDLRAGEVIKRLATIVVGSLVWLIPFTIYLGGVSKFVNVFRAAADLSGTLAQNLSVFLVYMVWIFGASIVALILRSSRILKGLRKWNETNGVLLLLVWVPALFFAFQFYAKGYALLFIAPLSILLAKVIETFKYRAAVATSIALCNFILFLFVPFVAPSAMASLNYEHRTARERLISSVLRGTSFYAPTLAHIRQSDRAIADANVLLSARNEKCMVIVDNAAALYAYPRSLQVGNAEVHILMPTADDSANARMYHAGITNYSYAWSNMSGYDSIFYLTDRELMDGVAKPPAVSPIRQGIFVLYDVPRDSVEALHHYLTELFLRTHK